MAFLIFSGATFPLEPIFGSKGKRKLKGVQSIDIDMDTLQHYLELFPEQFDGTESIRPLSADHITSTILEVNASSGARYIIKDTDIAEKELVHRVSDLLRGDNQEDVFLLPLAVSSAAGRHVKLYPYRDLADPARYLRDAARTLGRLHQVHVATELTPEVIVGTFTVQMRNKSLGRVAGTRYHDPVAKHLDTILDNFPSGESSRISACHLDPHPQNLISDTRFIDTDNVDLSLPEIDLGTMLFSYRRFQGVHDHGSWEDVIESYPDYDALNADMIEASSRLLETVAATWKWEHHPESPEALHRMSTLLSGSDACFE